jgi:glutamate racemase
MLAKSTRWTWNFLLLILLACTSTPACAAEEPSWLPELMEKERITIVVTDSGLGGLSVVADAAEKFRSNPVFRQVDLVFVSALFREGGGYNSLQTREQKLAVFSSALQAMADRYSPDLILVACNTLSVLAPETDFARSGAFPVAGIVETGVEQIASHLLASPEQRNLMFATRTTVEEGTHRERLLELGMDESQFIAQACPQLTQYIEQGFDAMDTELLIDAYVDEALSGMGEVSSPLTVSFNCTHFGYSLASWKLAFESRGVAVEAFLDPNTHMVDFLLPEPLKQRYPAAEVSVRAVSMIPIPDASTASIGRFLQSVSPATADALRSYEQEENLFEWRSLVEKPAD